MLCHGRRLSGIITYSYIESREISLAGSRRKIQKYLKHKKVSIHFCWITDGRGHVQELESSFVLFC